MAKEKKRYSYHVRDANGNYGSGFINATSLEALEEDFARRKFTFLEPAQEIDNSGLNIELNFSFRKGVKQKELAAFIRKFAIMLDADIKMETILRVLSQGPGVSKNMKATILDIKESLESGESLSKAFSKHPLIFSDLIISMIGAGETGGFLEQSMRQIQDNLDSEIKLKSKIKSAMTYPVVVLIMAAVMCAGMLIFIVPVFADMFAGLGGELPLPTRMLQAMSVFLSKYFILIGLAIGGAIFWWKRNKHKLWLREKIDPIKLKVPVFGSLNRKIMMSRFARNTATLMANGVLITKTLDIVAGTTGSTVLETVLQDVKDDLDRGLRLPDAMAKHPIFPIEDVEMIRVGDTAGDATPMLEQIAKLYDQEVEATTDALASLIEPLMIVFLGVVVGGMIIALYLPIFSISDVVKKS